MNKIDLDINAGRNSTDESSNEKIIHKIAANAVKAKEITEENGSGNWLLCIFVFQLHTYLKNIVLEDYIDN